MRRATLDLANNISEFNKSYNVKDIHALMIMVMVVMVRMLMMI